MILFVYTCIYMFLLELCQAFANAKLKYAVAGGFAVALHGAVRGTLDVDIIISLKEADFLLAERTMKKLGLVPRLPVSAKEVFLYREEFIKNRNMIAWSFLDPKDPTRLVDILINEDVSKMRSIVKMVQGKKIKILAMSDLIEMKKKAGRPQDLEDVRALESLS